MKKIIIKKSKIGQFDKGVFANRDFKRGEIVIKYTLKSLTKQEFYKLSEAERNFVHNHSRKLYLYSSPERYVNHSSDLNTLQNFESRCDVATRDIKKGEEITTDSRKDDFS
ncbi:MAG: SET domain-containing protein [Nanoarchaeota archaeon]|nr:SET domain-containing protein [Nanoarchaeota archaeon]